MIEQPISLSARSSMRAPSGEAGSTLAGLPIIPGPALRVASAEPVPAIVSDADRRDFRRLLMILPLFTLVMAACVAIVAGALSGQPA